MSKFPLMRTNAGSVLPLLLVFLLVAWSMEGLAADFALALPSGQSYVTCEGVYPGHLQGITTNGSDTIYWSFTTRLVKTDTAGKVVKMIDAIDHHGDLTFVDGKIYVAVNDRAGPNPGQFNEHHAGNSKRQWIYEYDANLSYVARHAIPEVIYGAGGVAHRDGHFWVVGGLPAPAKDRVDSAKYDKNHLYEYDASFQFVKAHELATGNTKRGIQTIEFGCGRWWLGTYETDLQQSAEHGRQTWQRQVYVFNAVRTEFSRFGFHATAPVSPYPDGALGISALPGGAFLVAGGGSTEGAFRGYVWMAEVDRGRLRVRELGAGVQVAD